MEFLWQPRKFFREENTYICHENIQFCKTLQCKPTNLMSIVISSFFFGGGIVSVVTLVNNKDLLSTVKSRKYYPKKISVTRIIKKAFPASEMLFIIL